MADKSVNPFTQIRERREHVITVRLTPAEHEAVITAVGNSRGAIATLIREGLGIAIEKHRKPSKK